MSIPTQQQHIKKNFRNSFSAHVAPQATTNQLTSTPERESKQLFASKPISPHYEVCFCVLLSFVLGPRPEQS
jgi:hypothetical protein